MKTLAKQLRRIRWGKGLCVVTRAFSGRLNISTFATPANAQDFARRATNAGVRIIGVV